MATELDLPGNASAERPWAQRLHDVIDYCRTNPSLVAGLGLLLILILVGVVGPHIVNPNLAQPTSVKPDQPPSPAYPLGSDDSGRDLIAVVVVGLPLTMEIGFVAGAIGLVVGTILGFAAGYLGGSVDAVLRTLADMLLTVPSLVVLVTIAATLKGNITIVEEAFVVSILAWMWPLRAIRSQVLSLRDRGYVQIAKLSGMRWDEIIVRELIPNLLPYLAASFVTSTAAAVLASIGLELVGLGPQSEPDMGMTIYWVLQFNALIRGLWWWWLTPLVCLALFFIALFLASTGLDQLANPRAHRGGNR
ncbi:MAG TPA: ABC transporter permease [Candidatus Dormibacteraeota bacterium]|jgi:peptide/nickel transport system permease protein|nr:ABC transporter permease [Candidatus Dormibacteraeota bacterium]